MEISGELHAPAALSPVEVPPLPIVWEAEWTTEPAWTHLFPFRESNTFPAHSVHNLVFDKQNKNKLRGLSPQARTIPTEPPPLVGEGSANFSG
jgi:hypothetical protein